MKMLDIILGMYIHIRSVIYMIQDFCNNTVVNTYTGSTIGCIRFNDENVITECCIYDDVMSKSRCFPKI